MTINNKSPCVRARKIDEVPASICQPSETTSRVKWRTLLMVIEFFQILGTEGV